LTTRQGITQDNPKCLKRHSKWNKQPYNEEEDGPHTPHFFFVYDTPINHNDVLLREIV